MVLDRKNRLIVDEIMGRGTVDHAPVRSCEIARRALEVQCPFLILAQNHPSGDDHPIVGTAGIVSFRSSGLI